ncbi:methyltransferase domain-containing protein [Kribbella sp. NPDC056861]|uniref:methyltransferase domain-containing protein n=1 Tax=Kribbella sp. NPDC056861 TaxID=3154857 RepID=UPI00343BE603
MTTGYTPGHTDGAVSFMARRSLQTHGQFFLPHLSPGLDVLDLGCGPGTISRDLAAAVEPGWVVAVDQADRLSVRAENLTFTSASCYDLPLAGQSVDRVFSHALFEHLASPLDALAEAKRVLRPGGVIGLCSPDWGGFLLSPPSRAVDESLECYRDLMISNGGDPLAGRKLGTWLEQAGFREIHVAARYENYVGSATIAQYLADQLDEAGSRHHATSLREWAAGGTTLFAQCWVSATGRR